MSDEKPPGHLAEQVTTDKAIEDNQTQTAEASRTHPDTLANMRHTLRTPLNHIIGYSEMLLEEAGERGLETFAADLQKIHGAGKQLLACINEFLNPSMTERAAAAHVSKTVTIGGLFREAELDSRSLAASHRTDSTTASGRILVVDDNEGNRDMLSRRLKHEGYGVCMAESGHEALALLKSEAVDLILLDVMMPEMDGYEVLSQLKADSTWHDIPVIMISALDEIESVVRCIERGAEDYLPKPFNPVLLRARIGACLEKKRLRDLEVQHARELAEWNKTLEDRVQKQVTELERLGRLKRFFSPQLAALIVSGDAEDPLKTHRRELTVVFLDLRGFTAFAETAEPEEVMGVLHEYHAAMGKLIVEYEGTLEHFAGDGMMIFFNDPAPVPNPEERAIRMTLAMRERVKELTVKWRKLGYDLDFGVGIAQGFATIGAIGFEERWEYGAIGTVPNLAARLCGEAKPGQILVPQRLLGTVEDLAEVEPVGELVLKGFHRPITAYNVLGFKG
jgi:DNA-binding response OmpR family regulator